jgi:hypothetical protein
MNVILPIVILEESGKELKKLWACRRRRRPDNHQLHRRQRRPQQLQLPQLRVGKRRHRPLLRHPRPRRLDRQLNRQILVLLKNSPRNPEHNFLSMFFFGLFLALKPQNC